MRYRLTSMALLSVVLSLCLPPATRSQPMLAGDWRTIDRDLSATRFSPLEQLEPGNVDRLREAWRFDLGSNSTAVPLAVDGVNWGGSALLGGSPIIYVNAHDGPLTGWLEDRDPDLVYGRGTRGNTLPYARASISGPGPYTGFTAPSGGFDADGNGVGPDLPCFRPPWAELIAVDASRGRIVWRSVLGLNESPRAVSVSATRAVRGPR